ncbi:ester cyclase [Gordonia hydrophobica]|uniref:Nuclear transport factor 2 family protein n=1 Tax=Gordonia hydrophobica TaxID=40516 RepID=A0ABZ2U1T5_9ACTN|nr:nuclear transport factor 2 family protein [Gordonia hydrophobica]MBM7366729.1 hypothetical protein [Gordonia hydrophobica]
MSESTVDARELYRRWIDELWNGPNDLAKLKAVAESLVSEDFLGHWPSVEVAGPGKLAALIDATRSSYRDLVFEIEVGPFADEGFVAGRWAGQGATSDGQTVYFSGNDILTVRDGRFTEYWVASSEM